MSEYGLLVSFQDQSETFVLGFEAGQLWEIMRNTANTFVTSIHAQNQELVMRMCGSLGWTPEFTKHDDKIFEGWINVKLTRGTRPKLSVVQPHSAGSQS